MSLFTTTCEPLPQRGLWPTPVSYDATPGGPNNHYKGLGHTAKHGSMSSAAASPARTSARQERAQELQALARDYGVSTPELLARFDRDTSSWRTSQLCLDGELSVFSETWPRSGLMRNGTAYQLPPLVRLTDETGSGLWRTPVASIVSGGAANAEDRKRQGHAIGLHDQVNTPAMWPTPRAEYDSGRHRGKTDTLHSAVKMFPTPTAQDASNNGGASQYNRNSLPLNAVIGGSLNPQWVEWLMGFPLGWTVCAPSATPSSRKSPKSSAEQS